MLAVPRGEEGEGGDGGEKKNLEVGELLEDLLGVVKLSELRRGVLARHLQHDLRKVGRDGIESRSI